MDKKILLELVKYLGGKENITKFWNCIYVIGTIYMTKNN